MDIQQLYTATKKFNNNFKLEFDTIPDECLIGVHVHERHRKPCCKHIPEDIWQYVADNHYWMGTKERPFHILPEVHHSNDVEGTYRFCKDFLKIED